MQRLAFKVCLASMKRIMTLVIAVLLTSAVFAQAVKKTSFRLLAGPVYTTKTNRQHVYNLNPGWGLFSLDEKAATGLSFQALVSFYLSKNWRLNTGIDMDEKGFIAEGVTSGPADGPLNYKYRKTAYYAGIPVSIETYLLNKKKFQLSVDAGLLPQWKTFTAKNGDELLKNQFTLMAGFYGKFPLGHSSILVHPVFRYSLSQIQDPLINDSKSPGFNAYSIGLEVGYSF